MEETRQKVYVTVTAQFDPEGWILPQSICWEDGRVFPVDRVLEVRPAASQRAGGAGLRYRCMIQGQETFLFLEAGKAWFVEKKCPGRDAG